MPEAPGDLKRQPNRAEPVTDLAELTERCRQGLSSKVPRFTKKVLAALVPAKSGKQVLISSAALACAYVVVEPSGHVRGTVQHRAIGPRKTIADFRIKTIEQYERRARAILDAAKDGRNLLAEERAAALQKKAALTVKAVIGLYLAEPKIRKKRSFTEKERYLEKVWADLHDHNAEAIERADIVPVLRRIAAKRGEVTANRARTNLAAMFSYAVMHGWLKRAYLPTNNLPVWEERSRERVLSLEELGKLWNLAPQVSPAYGAVVQLMELTGCRRSEIADLSWPEIDLDKALVTLLSSRVKNGREHLLPLAPAAVEILKAQPRVSDKVFPVAITWSRAKAKLDQLVGFETPFVIEDTRRSFSTGCREHLKPVPDHHLVELAINHVSGSRSAVAGTYDRSERLAERRRLFERWADVVLRAAGEPV